jgi:hypothetical protein
MQGGSRGIRMLVILAVTAFLHLELSQAPARSVLCGELQRLGFIRFHWAPPGLTMGHIDDHRDRTARGLRAPA